jgi:quercetin dioxygenase-like cupin family protein
MTAAEGLKAIARNVQTLRDTILDTGRTNGHVQYAGTAGSVEGEALYNDGACAVQQVTYSPGLDFPMHTHDQEREWLIVFGGEITVEKDGVERTYGPGEFVFLLPGERHNTKSANGGVAIAITIPADPGFPGVAGRVPTLQDVSSHEDHSGG